MGNCYSQKSRKLGTLGQQIDGIQPQSQRKSLTTATAVLDNYTSNSNNALKGNLTAGSFDNTYNNIVLLQPSSFLSSVSSSTTETSQPNSFTSSSITESSSGTLKEGEREDKYIVEGYISSVEIISISELDFDDMEPNEKKHDVSFPSKSTKAISRLPKFGFGQRSKIADVERFQVPKISPGSAAATNPTASSGLSSSKFSTSSSLPGQPVLLRNQVKSNTSTAVGQPGCQRPQRNSKLSHPYVSQEDGSSSSSVSSFISRSSYSTNSSAGSVVAMSKSDSAAVAYKTDNNIKKGLKPGPTTSIAASSGHRNSQLNSVTTATSRIGFVSSASDRHLLPPAGTESLASTNNRGNIARESHNDLNKKFISNIISGQSRIYCAGDAIERPNEVNVNSNNNNKVESTSRTQETGLLRKKNDSQAELCGTNQPNSSLVVSNNVSGSVCNSREKKVTPNSKLHTVKLTTHISGLPKPQTAQVIPTSIGSTKIRQENVHQQPQQLKKQQQQHQQSQDHQQLPRHVIKPSSVISVPTSSPRDHNNRTSFGTKSSSCPYQRPIITVETHVNPRFGFPRQQATGTSKTASPVINSFNQSQLNSSKENCDEMNKVKPLPLRPFGSGPRNDNRLAHGTEPVFNQRRNLTSQQQEAGPQQYSQQTNNRQQQQKHPQLQKKPNEQISISSNQHEFNQQKQQEQYLQRQDVPRSGTESAVMPIYSQSKLSSFIFKSTEESKKRESIQVSSEPKLLKEDQQQKEQAKKEKGATTSTINKSPAKSSDNFDEDKINQEKVVSIDEINCIVNKKCLNELESSSTTTTTTITATETSSRSSPILRTTPIATTQNRVIESIKSETNYPLNVDGNISDVDQSLGVINSSIDLSSGEITPKTLSPDKLSPVHRSSVGSSSDRDFLIDDEISDQPALVLNSAAAALDSIEITLKDSILDSILELEALKEKQTISISSSADNMSSATSRSPSSSRSPSHSSSSTSTSSSTPLSGASISSSPSTAVIRSPLSHSLPSSNHQSPVNKKTATTSVSSPTAIPKNTFRKPRALSVMESSDGSIRINNKTFQNLVKQDINGIKTLLLRLSGLLQNAETQNPFENEFSSPVIQNIPSSHNTPNQMSNHEIDGNSNTNNKDINDVLLENNDLKHKIMLLERQIEKKNRTIKLLQQQMTKYTRDSESCYDINSETTQSDKCSNGISPCTLSDNSNGVIIRY